MCDDKIPNVLSASCISALRCALDKPSQVQVPIRTQYFVLWTHPCPSLLFPFSVTSNHSPRQEPAARDPLPHPHTQSSHVQNPVSARRRPPASFLGIPTRGAMHSPESLLTLLPPPAFFGRTLSPLSSSSSELFFGNVNHSTAKALQERSQRCTALDYVSPSKDPTLCASLSQVCQAVGHLKAFAHATPLPNALLFPSHSAHIYPLAEAPDPLGNTL